MKGGREGGVMTQCYYAGCWKKINCCVVGIARNRDSRRKNSRCVDLTEGPFLEDNVIFIHLGGKKERKSGSNN